MRTSREMYLLRWRDSERPGAEKPTMLCAGLYDIRYSTIKSGEPGAKPKLTFCLQ